MWCGAQQTPPPAAT